MRNTTLTALLGLALACTLVVASPAPAHAASSDLTVTPADSWSPMVLLSDLQDWWRALIGSPDVKRGVDEDPNGAPNVTTTTNASPAATPTAALDANPYGVS